MYNNPFEKDQLLIQPNNLNFPHMEIPQHLTIYCIK